MAESSPIPTPDLDQTTPAGRSSPYGPQRGRVDSVSGGADSSPHEGEPSASISPPPDAPAMPPSDPRDVPATRTQSIPPTQADPDDQAAG
jgi:hypothetical protein